MSTTKKYIDVRLTDEQLEDIVNALELRVQQIKEHPQDFENVEQDIAALNKLIDYLAVVE